MKHTPPTNSTYCTDSSRRRYQQTSKLHQWVKAPHRRYACTTHCFRWFAPTYPIGTFMHARTIFRASWYQIDLPVLDAFVPTNAPLTSFVDEWQARKWWFDIQGTCMYRQVFSSPLPCGWICTGRNEQCNSTSTKMLTCLIYAFSSVKYLRCQTYFPK